MKYVLNSSEMKSTDTETIESIGIPSLVLMEQASLAVADRVRKTAQKDQSILVVAGCGNNGGDALCCARILLEDGYQVDYYIAGSMDHCSAEFACQYEILNCLGYEPCKTEQMKGYQYIIDGIFGIGLSRPVEGDYKELIEVLNYMGAYIFSIDIPSGVDANRGQVLGTCIHADETVTFGGYKRGHLLYPGKEHCGKVTLDQINFPEQIIKKHSTGYSFTSQDLRLFPERPEYSNKGTFGKILIIGGSSMMAGAACFAAKAAYAAGAGLVKIVTIPENRVIMQTMVPEAILGQRSDLIESLKWCDVVLVGPGIGVSHETKQILETVFSNGSVPVIVDADGLNTMSRYQMVPNLDIPLILTPHLMEAARLLNGNLSQIQQDLPKAAHDISETYAATVVLKDAATVVCEQNGPDYFNTSGNSGMAVGGSGDVLAGMIAGLVGRMTDATQAAVLSVYIHGCAGDLARDCFGADGMGPMDIINNIKNVINRRKI